MTYPITWSLKTGVSSCKSYEKFRKKLSKTQRLYIKQATDGQNNYHQILKRVRYHGTIPVHFTDVLQLYQRASNSDIGEQTWCRQAAMAVRCSTCRRQRAECRRTSCSSCTTFEDESSPSERSRYPAHPALDQTPATRHINTQPFVVS